MQYIGLKPFNVQLHGYNITFFFYYNMVYIQYKL